MRNTDFMVLKWTLAISTRILQVVDSYAKMFMLVQFERKVWRHARYGRTLYARGPCNYAEDFRIQSQGHVTQRNNQRHQDRRTMESQTSRVQTLSRLPKSRNRRRQKIKPPQWLEAMKDFTAVRLLLRFCRPHRSSLWCTLPVFSIASTQREVKVIQGMGTR